MTLGQKAEINNQVRYVDILEKSSLGRETKKLLCVAEKQFKTAERGSFRG